MPRKGYKPTGYRIKTPEPDTFIAEHTNGARLYAELADCPLYANARVIAANDALLPGSRRRSFRLGWVIEEQRFARGKDHMGMPADFLAWVADEISAIYPDLEQATGCTPAEIEELKREQAEKRAKYA